MNEIAEGSTHRTPSHGLLRKSLAWGVHFYTALGLVAAASIAVLIVRGDTASFRMAFILMAVATLIDATDGMLARAVRIKEVLPGFDGRRLDDLVDFLTYTALPLLLIWRARLLPQGQDPWLLLPLLARPTAGGHSWHHTGRDGLAEISTRHVTLPVMYYLGVEEAHRETLVRPKP